MRSTATGVMKKLKLAYVQWEDSATDPGWSPPHDDERFWIKSFGILVREGKKTVTLSTSKSPGGNYVDQITIPRSAIRKMRRVKDS